MTNGDRDRLGGQLGWIPPYLLGETSDQGPWISLGNGKYESKSTGMRKYVPNEDPAWKADLQRIGRGG